MHPLGVVGVDLGEERADILQAEPHRGRDGPGPRYLHPHGRFFGAADHHAADPLDLADLLRDDVEGVVVDASPGVTVSDVIAMIGIGDIGRIGFFVSWGR